MRTTRPPVKVYEVDGVDGYEWAIPVDPADHDVFLDFDRTPHLATWRPVPMRLVNRVDGGMTLLRDADMPWLGHHVLVLRRHAVDAIGDILRAWGELLPLACDDAELWVFHATSVVDALDMERSDLVMVPGSDSIMTIRTHVFRSEALRAAGIFKIPQMLRGSIYFREDTAAAVTAAGLTGLALRPVWESG